MPALLIPDRLLHAVLYAGTPGGKAKICLTISDPQVHFSFEMFQGLVSLETQARLEQLQVSKAVAAATAAMKASVAAAAAAADADSVALTQQMLLEEEVPLIGAAAAGGRSQQAQPKDGEPPLSTKGLISTKKVPKLVLPAAPESTSGGFVLRTSTNGGGVAASAGATAAGTPASAPMAVRVTNYSVSVGDLSMEGSLLLFLKNYAYAVSDAAGPGAQRRQRPLFGWASAGGGMNDPLGRDGFRQPAIVAAVDLMRLHHQRRGGAFGRALEELNAISRGSQVQPDEGLSMMTSSTSSTGSESPPRPPQALLRSLSWGLGDGTSQQQQEELRQHSQPRQSSLQPPLQQAQGSLSRGLREPLQYGCEDEEAVESAELLLLANLMAAGGSSTTRGNMYERTDGFSVQDRLLHHPQAEGLRRDISRRNGIGATDTPAAPESAPAPPPAEVGTSASLRLFQGVGEADFTDPLCRVIGFFLTLLNFKIPGETGLEIKGEVLKGAFEFHDAHGSLLKVCLLALEGQVYIHPELWSADSVKKFGGRLEVMVTGYDPMTNSQEELLHPVAASVEIQRQYVDAQASHWSVVNIRSAMDGVSVDITSGLLQLVYHIVRTTHEILQGAEGSLGRHTSLRVYNDIHSDVLVMHRRRSRDEPRGSVFHRLLMCVCRLVDERTSGSRVVYLCMDVSCLMWSPRHVHVDLPRAAMFWLYYPLLALVWNVCAGGSTRVCSRTSGSWHQQHPCILRCGSSRQLQKRPRKEDMPGEEAAGAVRN